MQQKDKISQDFIRIKTAKIDWEKKEVLIQIYLKAINLTKHLYHLQKKKKIVKIINLFKMQIPVLVLVLIKKMPEIIY